MSRHQKSWGGGDEVSTLCHLASENKIDIEEALGEYAYLMTEDDVPTTYEEAMASPEAPYWKKGCEKEHDRFVEMGTYDLVEEPTDGSKVLDGRWVFVRKRDKFGNVVLHKSRWVAKGFSQKKGVDYNQTYAPVAKVTTFRIPVSLAAKHNLEIR